MNLGVRRPRPTGRYPSEGHRLLETMDRCLGGNGRFDFTRLRCWGRIPMTEDPSHTESDCNGWFDGTATSGRSLEGLVWFFEATGDGLALDVAQRVAGHHLAHSTNEDGTIRPEIIDPENVGYNHFFHGTLRGLLRFGLLSGQRQYVERVAATYRNGLPQCAIKKSGWAPHDLGKTGFPRSTEIRSQISLVPAMSLNWPCGWR